MRKIYLFLFALLLTSGVAFAYTYNEGTAVHTKERSFGTTAEPVRVYMIVRYGAGEANTPSLSTGEVVVWDSVSDDGVTIGLSGTAGSTDSVAGVVVGTIQTSDNAQTAANSIGMRNWGYIQTFGPCSSAMVKSTTAAGQAIYADDANAGYATPSANGATGNSRLGSQFGFALDAVASTASGVEVFIKNR